MRVEICFNWGHPYNGPIEERMLLLRQVLLNLNTADGLSKDNFFGWVERWEFNKHRVLVEADIPDILVLRHHGFESKINKGWPNGAGAAWMIDKTDYS